MNFREHAGLFLLFSGWGLFLEWAFGYFWSAVGSCPWIYPDSPLRYTGWEVAPMWGLGGLSILQLQRAITEREKKRLFWVAVLLSLILLWITALSIVAV